MRASDLSRQYMMFLIFLCCSGTTAAEVPSAWTKPIEFPDGPLSQEELVAVPLDAVTYLRSSEELRNLMIFDSGGKEVPFRLARQTESKERPTEKKWTARNLTLKPSADELDIRFTLDDDDLQPTSLQIETPLRNFEQRVRVFGRSQGEETLLADGAVFDYSQYMDVRHVDVPLRENSFRSFRIIIDKLTSEQESQIVELTRTLQGETEQSSQQRLLVNRRPFRIDRIGLIRRETRIAFNSAVTQRWPASIEAITQDNETGNTVVEFSSSRQPLTKLTLVTASQNFGRRVHLEVPDASGVRKDWNQIASGTVSYLKYRDIDERKLDIEFPVTRSQVYRLVIENRNSPPLSIDGLEAHGHVHQLLFLAQPEESYELHYGYQADSGQQRDYDTVAIDRLMATGISPLVLQLGNEVEEDRATADTFSLKQLLNNSYFLGALVLAMAILLGSGLYRAARQVNAIEDSPPE